MPTTLQFVLQGSLPDGCFEHVNGLEAPVIQAHKSGSPKPYSVSPLLNGGDGISAFHLSLLDDELVNVIYDGFEKSGTTVRLGDDAFEITGIPAIVKTEQWEELMAQAIHNSQTQWSFDMLTPTATSGKPGFDKQCPTPSPEAYFSSWLHRWCHCAPEPYNYLFDSLELRDFVETGVAVSFFNGRTESVKVYKKMRFCPFIGFVGSVGFRVLNGVRDIEKIAALTALARLAPYCGTGKETMRGMGQTRLLG